MSDCKKCTKCGEIKPIDMYWRNNANRNGRSNQRKTCCKSLPSVISQTQRGRARLERETINHMIARFLRGEFAR